MTYIPTPKWNQAINVLCKKGPLNSKNQGINDVWLLLSYCESSEREQFVADHLVDSSHKHSQGDTESTTCTIEMDHSDKTHSATTVSRTIMHGKIHT